MPELTIKPGTNVFYADKTVPANGLKISSKEMANLAGIKNCKLSASVVGLDGNQPSDIEAVQLNERAYKMNDLEAKHKAIIAAKNQKESEEKLVYVRELIETREDIQKPETEQAVSIEIPTIDSQKVQSRLEKLKQERKLNVHNSTQ